MKKIIISLAIAGFISLGFTVVEYKNTPAKEVNSKTAKNNPITKSVGSNDTSDKRLASWD